MSDMIPDDDRVLVAATQPGSQITPAEFNRWIAEVQADAWEEGAYAVTNGKYEHGIENPYSEAS